MHVIGTAGHVDHGKSTLIEGLTGTHPDRLKEEREREMTIDLGFAWMTLPFEGAPEAEEVGIIDVPGHRDFIGNMLAGIGGIEAVLFVVAADEGVMPQTREHLAILDLLGIQGGVVALTKIDLVDDNDWLDLIETDLDETLQGTVLKDAPILRVSAYTGAGLAEIKMHLWELLKAQPPRPDHNKPRLPVDRVFTIAGFGTVVTGTLSDGSLKVGDEIEVLPNRMKGRVRGLQTHKQKEQIAIQGSRTAVNISGVSLDEITRGDVIAHPGDYQATQRIDVHFSLLPDVSQALKHNTDVKLYIGASESIARVRLLGVEALAPGDDGWLQLEIKSPVIAQKGDRYILRRPSPGETLGGGEVVDPFPKGRHRRFSSSTLDGLETLIQGSPGEILLQTLNSHGATTHKELVESSNFDNSITVEAIDDLLRNKQILNLSTQGDVGVIQPDALLISKSNWERLSEKVIAELSAYHRNFPLRTGMPREELKSRLKEITRSSSRLFNTTIHMLVEGGQLRENGPTLSLPNHSIQFSPGQQQSISSLMDRFATDPFSPPSVKECQDALGEDLYRALVETGMLTEVASDVVFRTSDYEKMRSDVQAIIEKTGSITVAQARDHFNTSRRYILGLLEHFDAIGFTIRTGDERKLRR